VLTVIVVSTCLAVLRADRELRTDLLPQVAMIATAINPQRMASLKGTEADLSSPDYLRIKAQLANIRRSNPRCRFLYLISRRPDGSIVFHVDSEPHTSRDCSPPGQVYSEAPKELHTVFDTGRATVKGPYEDRWGSWISAFVPQPDPETGGVQMVFGMDIAASDWMWTVALRAIPLAGLAVVAVMLTLLAASLYGKRRELRTRQEELRQAEGRRSARCHSERGASALGRAFPGSGGSCRGYHGAQAPRGAAEARRENGSPGNAGRGGRP